MRGRTGATVALAGSATEAELFTAEYEQVMAGRADRQVYQRVLKRMRTHAVMDGDDKVQPKCKHCGERLSEPDDESCKHCGHIVDSEAAKAGAGRRKCPSCGRFSKSLTSNHAYCSKCGAGFADGMRKSAGAGFEVLPDAERLHLAALMAKAQDRARRLEGMGDLIKALGPEVMARVMSGEALSPAEFTRAYLSNGRAGMTASAGRSPRIPDMKPISPEDFRRGPLTAGQERRSPLNLLPLPGNEQADLYGAQHPGTGSMSQFSGLGAEPPGPTVAVPRTVALWPVTGRR